MSPSLRESAGRLALLGVLLLPGAGAASPADTAPPPAAPAAPDREAALFGTAPAAAGAPPGEVATVPPDAPSAEVALEDPLRIGGGLYWRAQTTAPEDVPPDEWLFTAPALLDLYLDGRPNSRLRAYTLARMSYDPTEVSWWSRLLASSETTSESPQLPTTPADPRWTLDQLWFNLNLHQRAFVTVGRQHVKWGTARFWNPTDFLHDVYKDPLARYDERVGKTMVKVQLPWEAQSTNFYGIVLLEGPATVEQLGQLGGAARIETVQAGAELGLDLLVQRERGLLVGVDLSTPLGPLDGYLEAALRDRGEPRWETVQGPAEEPGWNVLATVGLEWSHKYNDEDSFLVGAEYFFNQLGYDDATLYPWLLAQGRFTPFYLGRHYAGVYGLLVAPGSWNDTTFLLATLGNLSDRSFLTRLDASVKILTQLTLEGFAAVHYGEAGGELNFSLDRDELRGLLDPGLRGLLDVVPDSRFARPVFELGCALRVKI